MILAGALRDTHVTFGWVVVVANALAGFWCLAGHRFAVARNRVLWPYVVVAQVTIFVQAILGVTLQNVEDLEPNDFHYLYGFSMIIGVALLYGYRQQMYEQRFLLYGGGSLFIMGLGIRAMFLG